MFMDLNIYKDMKNIDLLNINSYNYSLINQ